MSGGRRRWALALAVAAVPAASVLIFGHSGVHAARSFLFPGAGLLEASPVLAAFVAVAFVAATVAWLRWGTDWVLVGVVAAAMAASAAWGSTADTTSTAVQAAHEFPIVVLLAGLVGWTRTVLSGVPGFRWLAGRRRHRPAEQRLVDLPPAPRCRAVALLALARAADRTTVAAVLEPDVARRAQRIGLAARWRRGSDPFRVDHAYARAALLLTGQLDASARSRFAADAQRAPAGVPCSEPTWVRPLDATLAAAALEQEGEPAAARRWAAMLQGPLAMRRGHRPAWWWTPLGVAAGRCLDWEHALLTAIARERGWIGADDWPALRRRVLAAAARGSSRRDDERLIAAGRVWLALVHDPAAERIVERPTVRHDPLAVAIDRFARQLRANHLPSPLEGSL